MPELEDINDWDGDEADDTEAGDCETGASPNADCGAECAGGHPPMQIDSNHASCTPGSKDRGPTGI
eukprot:11179966-Lingulodinium_polyedra.AAC.1